MSELSLAEKFEAVESIDTSHLVFEDDTPVDSFRSEKQQRLLTEVLYSCWFPGVPFLAAAKKGTILCPEKESPSPRCIFEPGYQSR